MTMFSELNFAKLAIIKYHLQKQTQSKEQRANWGISDKGSLGKQYIQQPTTWLHSCKLYGAFQRLNGRFTIPLSNSHRSSVASIVQWLKFKAKYPFMISIVSLLKTGTPILNPFTGTLTLALANCSISNVASNVGSVALIQYCATQASSVTRSIQDFSSSRPELIWSSLGRLMFQWDSSSRRCTIFTL